MPLATVVSSHLDRKWPDLATIRVGEKKTGGSYKLKYNIMMSALSGPLNVTTTALLGSPHPLPSLWSTYSYTGDTDDQSYAKTYTVERDPACETRYYVTVNFEPAEPGEIPDGGGDPIKSEPNPMLRAPVFWWDREVTSSNEPIDVNGNAVLNYANNLYEEILQHDRTRGLLVAEFNVATQAEVVDYTQKYEGAVNSSTWTFKSKSLGPRVVLCREVSGSPAKEETSYTFYTVSMRFAFAPLGKDWDDPMPELGQHHLSKTSGTYDTNPDGSYKRTDAGTVVPLNSDGTRRPDNQPVLINKRRIKREVDFTPLTAIFART